MSGESETTIDHDTIKKWAEERNGKPARVKGTENNEEGGGVLRIHFDGNDDQNLKEISWDRFFKTFDESNLAMVYQEKTTDGRQSRFNKFIDRNSQ